jgi:hypothetical protein
LLTRMARSLTACEPVGELTWGELTLACSPARGTDDLCAFGRSAGLPGRRATRPRPSGRTPGSSPDWRRVSRSSGSLNGSRRTRSQKAGDGYPGRHVVSWAGQVDGAGSREDPLEFGGLRKVGSIDPDGPARPGLDLAPCIGVRLALLVYENTGRITRERFVGGIVTRKGQTSRGPCPGHGIGSHSAEELLARARLGLAPDILAHRRPVTAWS